NSREFPDLCAQLVSELVVRRAAQRVVSVEGLRSQARGVLEVTQLIVEVALQTGAVLALEIRQLIDRTLQRRLLRFEGGQGLIALGLRLAHDICCFLLFALDEYVPLSLTFDHVL